MPRQQVSRVGLFLAYLGAFAKVTRSSSRSGSKLVQRELPTGQEEPVHIRERLHRPWWTRRVVSYRRRHFKRLLRQ